MMFLVLNFVCLVLLVFVVPLVRRLVPRVWGDFQ
jgi:hypothetical protein